MEWGMGTILVAALVGLAFAMFYFTGKRTYLKDNHPGSAIGGLVVAIIGFGVGLWLNALQGIGDLVAYGTKSDNTGLVAVTWLFVASLAYCFGTMLYSITQTGKVAS